MLAGNAQAQTATIDGITYTANDDGQTATATGYTGNPVDVAIPATVNIDGKDYPVTAIGDFAFTGCTALQSVTLPEGLQTIGNSAFRDCTSLTSVTFPEELQTITSYAFSGCTALQSVTFPEWLQSIGNSAFRDCTSLTSVTFPEGLQTIGSSAFNGCTALQSITLPEGLQTIGYFAFESYESLENVTLPSTLQNIHARAFYECPLTDVYCHAATPPSIYNDSFDSFTNITATLHVPSDAVASYQAAEGWKLFQHIVGDLPSTAISSVATDASLATYADGTITTSGLADITVYAQSGAQVRHAADATSLSLAGLPRGIYIISIAQDGQQQVMKVAH